jgi:multisubunit Na+/H+ antiporter MnhB subunit
LSIELIEQEHPQFVMVHLPDADNTAHEHGADSEQYRDVLVRIDTDIARLVEKLQDGRTTFVVCADHGHVPPGGHGGWERDAVETPAIFLGNGIVLGSGAIEQSDIAPTIAALMGWKIPRHAAGRVRSEILVDSEEKVATGEAQYRAFAARYLEEVEGSQERLGETSGYDEVAEAIRAATQERLDSERADRLPAAAGLAGAALLVLVFIGAMSWRALVASLSGVGAYYTLYNALYFLVHGHHWSLSAFNTESYLQTFFNIRMAEAAGSALVGAAVAALVYAALRHEPHGPREKTYLAGWLALGPATVLSVQVTLALQVAWFLWAWGASVTWLLPDFKWGFKYDLDLIQATALGAAALLAPVVTYLVGRYHPKMRHP